MDLRAVVLKPTRSSLAISDRQWEFNFNPMSLRYVKLQVDEYEGEAVAINHVEVSGKAVEDIDFDVITGAAAAGAVGIGGSIAVANIQSTTDAGIRGSAVVAAGSDAGDDVLVQAKLQENFYGVAFAGAAGLVTP